jgi:hypothetical protein
MGKKRKPAVPPPGSAFAGAANLMIAANNVKEIAGTKIVGRIASALHLPTPIDPDLALDEVGVGDLIPWDHALTVMACPPFKADGLELRKADVMHARTVGEFGDLVFQWYDTNGWTIVDA